MQTHELFLTQNVQILKTTLYQFYLYLSDSCNNTKLKFVLICVICGLFFKLMRLPCQARRKIKTYMNLNALYGLKNVILFCIRRF